MDISGATLTHLERRALMLFCSAKYCAEKQQERAA